MDFQLANDRIWEELTPDETSELLLNAVNRLDNDPKWATGFAYWLYWLQQLRYRLTNANFARVAEVTGDATLEAVDISRLKSGRRRLNLDEAAAFYQLYLLDAQGRGKIRREVIKT